MIPKRGIFLCPKPKQPVIRGHSLNPVPEQGPQLVRQREITERFAMNAAMPLGDLQSQCSNYLIFWSLGDLELSHAFAQIGNRKSERFPKLHQLGNIVERGPPQLIIVSHR